MHFDRTELKAYAKLGMKKRKPSVYVVSIIFIIISFALSYIQLELWNFSELIVTALWDAPISEIESQLNNLLYMVLNTSPLVYVLYIVISIVTGVMQAGFMSYCLKVSRNHETDMRDIFDGFSFFFKVVWLNILMNILISLWSLLFIVPGIIAYYRYSQAIFLLFDNPEMSALDCIRKSKELTMGHKADLFVLDFSFFGWLLLGVFIEILIYAPVLSVWLDPYMCITKANYYNMLIGHPLPNYEQQDPMAP